MLHTNLDGFYNLLKPCIMPMIGLRRGGRIVTISSVSGLMGNRGQVNYSAAKAGIMGATKALALELAKRKITVNCVAPGLIDTGMVDAEVKAEALKLIPLKRMGQADEVAGLVSYLMSDIAGYVTRQVISINGAWYDADVGEILSDVDSTWCCLCGTPAYLCEWRYGMKRVVVTGMAGVTAFGQDWPSVRAKLQAGRNAVVAMPEWAIYEGSTLGWRRPLPILCCPPTIRARRRGPWGESPSWRPWPANWRWHGRDLPTTPC